MRSWKQPLNNVPLPRLGSRWTHHAARWRGPNALEQPPRKALHHPCSLHVRRPQHVLRSTAHHNQPQTMSPQPMHRYWMQGIDLLLLPLGLL